MILTSNISSRSLFYVSICLGLLFAFAGVGVSTDSGTETANASVSTHSTPSNQASTVSSEDNDSSYDYNVLDSPQVNITFADHTSNTSPLGTTSSILSQETGSSKTPKQIHKDAQQRAEYSQGDTPVMTRRDKREILWLARIVYSETKRPHEQRLIAWVVRNRVDTGYTGRTYERVANESSQFSGLQKSDPRYEHNMSRWWASSGESWKSALAIAKDVYFAPESERPFAITTRHFYSPVAVNKPDWARGREAVHVINGSRSRAPRFAFYASIR